MSALLAAPEVWTTKPAWTGAFAPGGKYEAVLVAYADFAAWWHKYLSKVPNVVWVMISGAVMNLVLGLFHSKEKKEKERAEVEKKAGGVALTREEQRAALKERSVSFSAARHMRRHWGPALTIVCRDVQAGEGEA